MTKDQLLAQAIRNEMGQNQASILRLEGENRGLQKVLGQLESGGVVASKPPNAGDGGGSEPSVPPPAPEDDAARDIAAVGGGSGDEGCAQGTDGGAA